MRVTICEWRITSHLNFYRTGRLPSQRNALSLHKFSKILELRLWNVCMREYSDFTEIKEGGLWIYVMCTGHNDYFQIFWLIKFWEPVFERIDLFHTPTATNIKTNIGLKSANRDLSFDLPHGYTITLWYFVFNKTLKNYEAVGTKDVT